ncbi:hypothetical protein BAUCODRAFT_38296 [Baudoinia panamericana UAMH 10762]|uniref:Uncharacterized protein n=1 Tax=Baudoinia panamericana (strain UAMH 10762) TaxID=717646 RepID=M2MLI9_BAUPA|nr:uncharacterized protein BAUCODRAFT_38296 [Baudoinia panamericana UAMH 10762]EMC92263.1 hypothetical protein BAUCODRAFT_38296 [Baudoinia panamericana UAMH 10762]
MPKMPPRKEQKETVVYAASKRKAPPFKPQRPSKVPRVSTTESESSRTISTHTSRVNSRPAESSTKAAEEDDADNDSASDEELADNPLDSKKPLPPPAKKPRGRPPSTTAKSKAVAPRNPSPLRDSSPDLPPSSPPVPVDLPPPLTPLSDPTRIPQPLLVRLLHEHFVDKQTKIDKHAVRVLQKYMEVFVREAIARAAVGKREAVEREEASVEDVGWLELEDLEKVAGGMMLDF